MSATPRSIEPIGEKFLLVVNDKNVVEQRRVPDSHAPERQHDRVARAVVADLADQLDRATAGPGLPAGAMAGIGGGIHQNTHHLAGRRKACDDGERPAADRIDRSVGQIFELIQKLNKQLLHRRLNISN